MTELEALKQRLDEAESILSDVRNLLDDVHCYETEEYQRITEYFDEGDE